MGMENQSSSMNTLHASLVIVTEQSDVCPAFCKCNKGLISQEGYKVFPLVTKKIINTCCDDNSEFKWFGWSFRRYDWRNVWPADVHSYEILE